MKAILVLFDSLARGFLPPYGNAWVRAPHFSRLARESVTFDGLQAGGRFCRRGGHGEGE